MSIKMIKLKKYNPSMSVPGRGTVEIPQGSGDQQGGRDLRSARHFADVMSPFAGDAGTVEHQYTSKGKSGR